MNGKRNDFTLEDLKACAKTASMKRGRVETIVNEVFETVSLWRNYADDAGIPGSLRDQVRSTLRLEGFK